MPINEEAGASHDRESGVDEWRGGGGRRMPVHVRVCASVRGRHTGLRHSPEKQNKTEEEKAAVATVGD